MSEKFFVMELFPLNSEKVVLLLVRNYQEGRILNWKKQLLAYVDVNIVAENVDTIKTQTFVTF
jgi:hypothetical protein